MTTAETLAELRQRVAELKYSEGNCEERAVCQWYNDALQEVIALIEKLEGPCNNST